MPPGDELVYLAQVLHHDAPPVSGQIALSPRAYGGQSYEADVVDFEDERVSELLRAARDDEIVQVMHRARLVALDPRVGLTGIGDPPARRGVRLVLHTSHPVPGLRVDELVLAVRRTEVSDERSRDAEERIVAAVERLRVRGEPLTVTAVAREARAHKATVAKVLGTPVAPKIPSHAAEMVTV